MSSDHDDSVLPFGVYETPVTARVRERLERTKSAHPTAGIRLIDEHDEVNAHRYQVAVSRGISRGLARRLGERGSPAERLALIHSITKVLGNVERLESAELRYAIFDPESAAAAGLPEVPCRCSALFTNAIGATNLSTELAREIKTADSVDLLCAFVKNSGISVLHDQLEFL